MCWGRRDARHTIGLRLIIRGHSALLSFWRCSRFMPCVPSLLLSLVATRPTLLLRFPLFNALLVPDRAHSKLAVGARYAPEVPPREVGKHRVALEAQAPSQSRCVQDLIVFGHL